MSREQQTYNLDSIVANQTTTSAIPDRLCGEVEFTILQHAGFEYRDIWFDPRGFAEILDAQLGATEDGPKVVRLDTAVEEAIDSLDRMVGPWFEAGVKQALIRAQYYQGVLETDVGQIDLSKPEQRARVVIPLTAIVGNLALDQTETEEMREQEGAQSSLARSIVETAWEHDLSADELDAVVEDAKEMLEL